MGARDRARARIVLVESSGPSLADLMTGVATAARQPGVSVVSMSWGFAEGQTVLASDEALYDSVFDVPGVTFVASAGDYGGADPSIRLSRPTWWPWGAQASGSMQTVVPERDRMGI